MNWNPPHWVPVTKFFFEFFFRLTIFFFRNKKSFSKEQLLFNFFCSVKQKRISERSAIFWKFLFLEIYIIKKVWMGGFQLMLILDLLAQWSLSVVFTPQKYQCDSMDLHQFFYHSAIVSGITFHAWKSVDCYFSNKVYRDILRFL